jgi:hypothetical protein
MAGEPDELAAFLQLWTAKEAVGKALGQGLRKAGLRRRMPLPVNERAAPANDLTLRAGLVPSEPSLTVLHLPVPQAVLAVAVPATVDEVLLIQHHGAALRRTVRSRTSFPVVVRGS